jgi:hypothetical protein
MKLLGNPKLTLLFFNLKFCSNEENKNIILFFSKYIFNKIDIFYKYLTDFFKKIHKQKSMKN